MWLCKMLPLNELVAPQNHAILHKYDYLLEDSPFLERIRSAQELSQVKRYLDQYCVAMDAFIDDFSELKLEMAPQHTINVRKYSLAFAQEMGLSLQVQRQVSFGAALHDIGKTHLPDNLLKKPGGFTPDEKNLARTHSVSGAEIVGRVPIFQGAEDEIVLFHHEDWDGRGYPQGLKGDMIPLTAQIVHVADAFDVKTNKDQRAYLNNGPFTPDEALTKFMGESGEAFSPAVISDGLLPYVEKGCPEPKWDGLSFMARVRDEIDIRNLESVKHFIEDMYLGLPQMMLTMLDSSDGHNLRGCNPYPFGYYGVEFAKAMGFPKTMWRDIYLHGLMESVPDMWLPEEAITGLEIKKFCHGKQRDMFAFLPGFESVLAINMDYYENYHGENGLLGLKGRQISPLAAMLRVPAVYVQCGESALHEFREKQIILDPELVDGFFSLLGNSGRN